MKPASATLILTLAISPLVQATPAVEELLEQYRQEGIQEFKADLGKTLYFQEFKSASTGEIRQCADCHTTDLRAQGKHAETGKIIDPLAPSINPQRLLDIKEINKWLKRNCKWTLGRECTAQEKGNLLIFIQTQ